MRSLFLIFSVTAFFSSLLFPFSGLKAQTGCSNPIKLNSVIVINSNCGSSTGGVILLPEGQSSDYSYTWSPSVSAANIASDLPAGVYSIKISRISEPVCVLDTTVVVNNSGGPAVDIVSIQPAHCLANNGKAILSPSNLAYTWSNGETGFINDGLISQIYYVTATLQATGCYSVIKVTIPNQNPLQSGVNIIKDAKCGRPTGKAEIIVAGGSGTYAYSLSATNIVKNLYPGAYVCDISDVQTGCKDAVAFNIDDVQVTGSIQATAYDVSCPGGSNGFISYTVVPGENFDPPYQAFIRDDNGVPHTPGNLKAGTYFISIYDADSCVLPVKKVEIKDPPDFSAQATVIPETCLGGGSITLILTGGNAQKTVDWFDLPGTNNPQNRTHLTAGVYKARVIDSLLCEYDVDSLPVPNACGIHRVVKMLLPVNSKENFCYPTPPGVGPANIAFSLSGGGASGASSFGSWSIQPNGCFSYQAFSTPGFAVDSICLVRKVSYYPGLTDTICIVVSISALPVPKENVYFTVQTNKSGIACGILPPNFANFTVYQMDQPGLVGSIQPWGNYSLNPANACLTFYAAGDTGFNLPPLRVGVYDKSLKQGKIICYYPSVIPALNCDLVLNLPETLEANNFNCPETKEICIPLTFSTLGQFTILKNGQLLNQGLSPCNEDTVRVYNLTGLPGNGPFQLTSWNYGGQNLQGVFADVSGLVALMNQVDPQPGWVLQSDKMIIGGNELKSYGFLKIRAAGGQELSFFPSSQVLARGTEALFSEGSYQLVFTNNLNGCRDTTLLNVACVDCPPAHNYPTDIAGNIAWKISSCADDSLFCSKIPWSQKQEYQFRDNNAPINTFSLCGGFTAFPLDTGKHALRILHIPTNCEYIFSVNIQCDGTPSDTLEAVPDELFILVGEEQSIDILANDIVYGIKGNKSGLEKVEFLSDPDFGVYDYDPDGTFLYRHTGDDCGIDSVIYRITDKDGQTDISRVRIRISCDKLLVYTGFSPNNDNLNDFWHILGIDRYPSNEVSVYNRWGNLVFSRKAYTNENAWDGRWEGKELPDGAYFYLIDLGDGSKGISGYLHIMR